MIFGPAIHIDDAKLLSSSDVATGALYAALATGKSSPIPDTNFTEFVDVRDVARAIHVTLAKHVDGRLNLSGGAWDFQILANIGRRVRPDLDAFIPLGKPDEPTPLDKGSYSIDVAKANQLGITFTPLEATVRDTIARMEAIGAYNH